MKAHSIIPLFTLLFFLSGCNRYQYISFSSDLPATDEGAHYFDNDSVRITYQFLSGGQHELEITNKLDELIYVDWEKSFFIYEGESLPIHTSSQTFSGSSSSTEVVDNWELTDFNGVVKSSPYRSFIPPGAGIKKRFSKLPIGYMSINENKDYEKATLPNQGTGKKYRFTKADSIHFHSSYIYLVQEQSPKPLVVKNSFWATDLLETLSTTSPLQQNQVRTSESTGAGAVLGTLGIGALVVIAVQNSDEL